VRFGTQDEVTARFKLGDGELTTGLRRPVGDLVTDGEMLQPAAATAAAEDLTWLATLVTSRPAPGCRYRPP